MNRFLRSLTRWVDRGFIGPEPNTHRLPFRPTWDTRRLEALHIIDDDDDIDPPFPPADDQ